ncbi:MAG: undecaprenyl-phosphate glucose phosphotransferase, partial [Pseudorhodoplanes sp.]
MVQSAQPSLSASPASAAALVNAQPVPRRTPALSPAALAVASEQTAPAFSPIVLSGAVRGIELLIMTLVGTLAYIGYVWPGGGPVWTYAAAVGTISALALLAFQAADIYDVNAFRRPVSQIARLISAWSIVFLIVTAVSFFARIGMVYSRVWVASFYGFGMLALVGARLVLYRRMKTWTREGRLTRRTA